MCVFVDETCLQSIPFLKVTDQPSMCMWRVRGVGGGGDSVFCFVFFFSRRRSQPLQPLISALPRLSELAGCYGNGRMIPSLSSRDQQGPPAAAEGGDTLWDSTQPRCGPKVPLQISALPQKLNACFGSKMVNRQSIPGAAERGSCMISG